MLTNLFRSPEEITVGCESIRLSFTRRLVMTVIMFTLTVGMTLGLSRNAFAQRFQQTNLVSDVPGMAPTTDPNLVNPWGLARSASSPWWVADNGTGVSTLYNGAGAIVPLVVTIPVPPGGTPPSAPTGTVFNGGPDFFGDRFIFVTEDGTISGWSSGTSAVLRVNRAGSAIYKGVTIAQKNGANFLYAANFFAGAVEVFDRNYMPVTLAAGAFSDPFIPTGFAPFNVQIVNGMLFVAYAEQDEDKKDEVAGPGLGYVDAFDASGNLLLRLQSGSWMNAPWGVTFAPANFFTASSGSFGGIGVSNTVLVGQFGSGQIAMFDLKSGGFHGLLLGADSQPLTIEGLWALSFGNGAAAGPTNTLFFTAGIDDEEHGLFGKITPIAGP
jgi:uncharacterized protein (TIGR03118 family)